MLKVTVLPAVFVFLWSVLRGEGLRDCSLCWRETTPIVFLLWPGFCGEGGERRWGNEVEEGGKMNEGVIERLLIFLTCVSFNKDEEFLEASTSSKAFNLFSRTATYKTQLQITPPRPCQSHTLACSLLANCPKKNKQTSKQQQNKV